MAISDDQVLYIAHLSRLEIEDSEIHPFQEKLTHILEMVDKMNQVDTTDIEPMLNVLDDAQRMREDIVTETDQHKLYQKNAPQTEAGLYLVPKVIEG